MEATPWGNEARRLVNQPRNEPTAGHREYAALTASPGKWRRGDASSATATTRADRTMSVPADTVTAVIVKRVTRVSTDPDHRANPPRPHVLPRHRAMAGRMDRRSQRQTHRPRAVSLHRSRGAQAHRRVAINADRRTVYRQRVHGTYLPRVGGPARQEPRGRTRVGDLHVFLNVDGQIWCNGSHHNA